MDLETKRRLTVNGFIFGSEDDMELAQQELSAANFIDKKIEGRNPETVKAVYQAALDKKMFRTPVGYSYLRELQIKMLRMGLDKEDIPAIPLLQIYNDNLKEDLRPARTVIVKKRRDGISRQNTVLKIVVAFLLILIIALFAISMTGSNPNVLNYRYAVQNEYSDWEEDLKEREKAVRLKERELGITSPIITHDYD